MFWIQNAWHSTDITDFFLEKNKQQKLILKKYQQTTKPWQITS